MTQSRSPDTPRLTAGDDSLEPGAAPVTGHTQDDSPADRLLAGALAAMTRAGDDADPAYQGSLDSARERAAEVVDAVRSRYEAMSDGHYLERWGMVELLTDLRHPATVSVLEAVLDRPIPPERSPNPAHGFSTVAQEVIIRTTAVEGLARLAADGDESARALLLRQVRHEVFSVRRAAVQAIQGLDDADLLATVRREVEGTDDERLLQLRTADVQSVPQAEGGRFLKPDLPPPPPEQRTT